jgi:hypothetical protein
MGGMNGLPYFDGFQKGIYLPGMRPNIFQHMWSLYLPWWEDNLALSAGFGSVNGVVTIDTNNLMTNVTIAGTSGFKTGLIWSPFYNVEFTFALWPAMGKRQIGSDGTIFKEDFNFPPIELGVSAIRKTFGAEARLNLFSGTWTSIKNGQTQASSTFSGFEIYFGMLYKSILTGSKNEKKALEENSGGFFLIMPDQYLRRNTKSFMKVPYHTQCKRPFTIQGRTINK